MLDIEVRNAQDAVFQVIVARLSPRALRHWADQINRPSQKYVLSSCVSNAKKGSEAIAREVDEALAV